MEYILALLMLISILGLLLCVFSPLSVKWLIPGQPTRLKGIPIFIFLILFFFISLGLTLDTIEHSDVASPKKVKQDLQDEDGGSDSIVKITKRSETIEQLNNDLTNNSSGLGITRDSLVSAIHSWNSQFYFVPLGKEGILGQSGQTMVMIIGSKEDTEEIVLIVMMKNYNVFDMHTSGVDLVMMSDAIVDGSSLWVENMIDKALLESKTRFEQTRTFGDKTYKLKYEPNEPAPGIELTIERTRYEHRLDKVEPMSIDEFIKMKEIEKDS